MAVRTFDELKIIQQEIDDAYIRKVITEDYEKMDLDEEDRQKRIKTCCEFERAVRNLFMLIVAGEITEEESVRRLNNDYTRIIGGEYLTIFTDIYNHLKPIITVIFMNLDSIFMTSAKHSIDIAESEVNAAANHNGMLSAYENGRTEKLWVPQMDNAVRDSHAMMAGVKVGILDYFSVGGIKLLYPNDWKSVEEQGATTMAKKQICGCRCSVQYM